MNGDTDLVLAHYQNFFEGHAQSTGTWDDEQINKAVPGFKVFRAEPGPQLDLWSYASLGANAIRHPNAGVFEFIIHSPEENDRLTQLLAMITYYHMNNTLGIGHTLPNGEPWLPGSSCDYWLVSRPYPLGPDFEICELEDTHAHIAWLLPITERERDYKSEHGLDALERIFEERELEYWDIYRPSTI